MYVQENDSLTTKIETWLKKSSRPKKVHFDPRTGEGLEAAWDLVKRINKMQKLNLKLPNLSRSVGFYNFRPLVNLSLVLSTGNSSSTACVTI